MYSLGSLSTGRGESLTSATTATTTSMQQPSSTIKKPALPPAPGSTLPGSLRKCSASALLERLHNSVADPSSLKAPAMSLTTACAPISVAMPECAPSSSASNPTTATAFPTSATPFDGYARRATCPDSPALLPPRLQTDHWRRDAHVDGGIGALTVKAARHPNPARSDKENVKPRELASQSAPAQVRMVPMQLPPATPVADALASTGASARRSEIDAAPVTSAPSTATPSTKAATLAITSANAFPPGFRKPRRLGITGAPRRLIGTEDSNVPGAHVDEEYRASAAVAPPATRELSERTAESDASNGSAERSPPSYEGLSSSSKKRHSPSDSGADIASDGDGSASRACGSAATVVQPLLGGQNNEHQSSPVSATPPSVSKQEYIDLPTPISRSPLPRITSVEDVNMLGTSLMPHFASMDVTADVVQRTAVGGASAPSTGISPVESARSVDSSTVDGQQSTSAKSSAPASVPVLPTANKRNTLVVNGKPYMKLEMVGRGGSSKVYRVLAADGRLYAVKRVNLRGGVDQATIRGYVNEIALLRRLASCEYIIKLYDHELHQNDGVLHMVMECGEIDLAHVLQRQSNNMNVVRVYWQQMLLAVQAIHEQRVVHSDLKPANFLFVRGALKLIDFGIARAIQNDTTNIHRDHQVGTLNFMSPEAIIDTNSGVSAAAGDSDQQQQCMKIGRPSDVWSLGCILYQMVYGRAPFAQFSNVIQKLQKIIDPSYAIEFPPLDSASANPFLIETLRGCLRRDPKRRLTIPELLEHPFIQPDKVIAHLLDRLKANGTTITNQNE